MRSSVVSKMARSSHYQRVYHIALQIFFLLLLESFKIFEDTGTSISDILLGDYKSLLELCDL